MTSTGSITRRMQLGAQLRALRESRGISRADAGFHIRASESKISRLELGRVGFKERDVADLLTLYKVTDPAERLPLLELAAAANAPGWWQPYQELLPAWQSTYLGLEESASLIRCFEPQFIPQLLQTPDYTAALAAAAHPKASKDELAARVALAAARQAAFFRPDGPRLWCILDESALHRAVGGPDTHRAQLAHLLTVPQVTLQLLPYSAAEHPAQSGAFTLLRFPDQDLKDIACVTTQIAATQYDKPDEVDSYQRTMTHLTVTALTPDDTQAHLDHLITTL
ncbi:helix-turn-helix transcriptional regulator [Actinocorallia lasiicapitis]